MVRLLQTVCAVCLIAWRADRRDARLFSYVEQQTANESLSAAQMGLMQRTPPPPLPSEPLDGDKLTTIPCH